MEHGTDVVIIKEEAPEMDIPLQQSKKKRKRDAENAAEEIKIKVNLKVI